MSLRPLIEKKEIKSAYKTFAHTLKADAQKVRRWIGWPGGSGEFDVYWRSEERIWSVFAWKQTTTRYWCCFGVAEAIVDSKVAKMRCISPD